MNWEEVPGERQRKAGRNSKKSRNRDRGRGRERARNKEFARVTYFFVILFIALMIYIVYFTIIRAGSFVNSPYNKRQDLFAETVVRGDIVDRNGNVLAETLVADDGTETRNYPYGSVFAHVIGYSDTELGKTGLESVENFELLTSNAFFVEKIQNEFSGEKNMGDTVVTTLDADLQQAAYDALGDNKGAVIVMEADTGKILAMVSKPTFDPNEIRANWKTLNSSFKVVTTLAFMRQNSNYADYTYDCTGGITVGDTTIHCAGGSVHGHEDLESSLANSCNASFSNIGLSLNIPEYRKTAEDLLFNESLPGVLDYTKSSFTLTEDSGSAEVMMTAMGQGNTMVSPYHMALITQAIANGGTLMEPYLVDSVTNYTGSEVRKNVPKSYRRLMTSEEAAQLKEYMTAVVEEGTASVLSGKSYTVAGKTGTAEYSMSDKDRTHSWFIGFTNVDDPELVITVITEGSDGSASGRAVSLAGQILDSYYN